MTSLTGKAILVTGGAHRVGKSIALSLAREGASVAITYRSSLKTALQTVEELKALNVQAVAFFCDQTDILQIQKTVADCHTFFGRLDGLVNNAAIMQEIPFLEITPENWAQTMDTNTRAPFFFAQAASKFMQAGEGGSIINILDESAQVATRYYIHHSASKAALRMLTLSTALELAPRIRVNAVLPGPVLMPEGGDEERWKRLEKNTPLKRLGSPDDVARAVLYLMKEDFITGQVLVVDGGRTIK
ncbi:MAG: SDR family NAD(P)-dependent oxidoreductase [Anaerolineaceae bacterium]